ncbi:MAG: hypothetical protein AAGF30_15785 [Pseudomonadota bacterium]
MIRLLLPFLFILAACGVDGPPIPPNQVERDGPIDDTVEETDEDRPIRGGSVLINGTAVGGIRADF